MKDPPAVIEIEGDERDELLGHLRRMDAAHSGWMNLQPRLAEGEKVPERGWIDRVFSAKGPPVPICTWVPGHMRRDSTPAPTSLGVQHGLGRRAEPFIVESGVRGPSSWRVLTDNAKRGLVIEVPAGEDPAVCLDWLMRVAEVLCPLRLSGRWRAGLYS